MTILGEEHGTMIWYGNDENIRGAIVYDDGEVVFGWWRKAYKQNHHVLVTSRARRPMRSRGKSQMQIIKRWMEQGK